ncbi:cupin domain-containing protein [Streptomyces sp. NPDC058401]|uniref:cupin domain-containing protein n=1 Tax=Streptomyces sp. NPDC058401 TaxID=3346480 RepID=UPI00364FC3F3
MSVPRRVIFELPEVMPSGMVVEEVAALPGPGRPDWPFKASRFLVPPGATSEPDHHEVAELWMVRAGTGIVLSEDKKTEIGPGDSVFFPPWTHHHVVSTGAGPLEVFSLWWPEALS